MLLAAGNGHTAVCDLLVNEARTSCKGRFKTKNKKPHHKKPTNPTKNKEEEVREQ
jgi:hypothetical protein